MARAVLISNPVASRTTMELADTVRRTFRAGGWAVDWLVTCGPVDARRFAEAAVESGADVVAVLGGDGTTMQAAAGLVGTGVPLGLVPGGTGNVLAGNLRIPAGPIQATELILRGRSRLIDLGRIDRPDGIHYFGVACGAGADARVMGGTAPDIKRTLGIGGYFTTVMEQLPAIRSVPFRITIDGETTESRAAVVLVLNCGEIIPPFIRVSRTAAPDDGWFDVLAFEMDSPWQGVRGLLRVLANVALDTGETGFLSYGRGREVTIDADAAEPVQFDGDVTGVTPVTAIMQANAIYVMAPES